MRKSELKKLIKPLVKECIKECLVEEGILSSVVSEVVRGMGAPLIQEQTKVQPPPKPMFQAESIVKKPSMNESKKKLLEAIGREAYGGVDLFEGTTPDIPQQSTPSSMSGPLSDVEPGDPGVDISGIVALGGSKWKAFMG